MCSTLSQYSQCNRIKKKKCGEHMKIAGKMSIKQIQRHHSDNDSQKIYIDIIKNAEKNTKRHAI